MKRKGRIGINHLTGLAVVLISKGWVRCELFVHPLTNTKMTMKFSLIKRKMIMLNFSLFSIFYYCFFFKKKMSIK